MLTWLLSWEYASSRLFFLIWPVKAGNTSPQGKLCECENLSSVLRLKEQFEEFEEQQHGMSVFVTSNLVQFPQNTVVRGPLVIYFEESICDSCRLCARHSTVDYFSNNMEHTRFASLSLTVLIFMLTPRSVCIRQVRNRSLSPNTVVGCFLLDSVVGMVHVNDQVPVVVVGWLKVGDHTAGDAQEAHHWSQIQRSESVR